MDILWGVKPVSFPPKKSSFIQTFSHMPFFKMRFHPGMRLPSLLDIVQAFTKAPRVSHTYSLRSYTAQRSIDEDDFFFPFFTLVHWNAMVCVFWTLSGENSIFAIFQRIHIPEFLRTNAKKSPEMFGDETWTQGSYTMAMVVRDCCPEVRRDLSMCGYLYPCAKYISHPFVVCVRGGGMRSGWWYALPRSMRSESGEPYKIQTNPISFLFWVLGTGKVEPLSCSPHVYRRDFAPSQ